MHLKRIKPYKAKGSTEIIRFQILIKSSSFNGQRIKCIDESDHPYNLMIGELVMTKLERFNKIEIQQLHA